MERLVELDQSGYLATNLTSEKRPVLTILDDRYHVLFTHAGARDEPLASGNALSSSIISFRSRSGSIAAEDAE